MFFATWLILAFVLTMCAVFIAGTVLLWLAVAAGLTAILSLFFIGWVPQLVIFACIAVGLFILARSMFNKPRKPNPAIVGDKVTVTEAVNRYGGQIQLQTGEVRNACLAEGQDYDVINREEEAIITQLEGSRVMIRKF